MGLKEEKFKKDLGIIFREAREKQQLTQEEVAKKAGIHANYYARIERAGKTGPMPRADILQKIAKALRIELRLPLED